MLRDHNGQRPLQPRPSPQKLSHRFLDYRVAMHQLAEIADSQEPAYVRVQALKTIVRETSPNNPNHREVMRQLNGDPPRPVATTVNGYISPEVQKACVDAMLSSCSQPAEQAEQAETEEASREEEDEPL